MKPDEYTAWVQEQNALYEENKRTDRWHATYNAALSGFCSQVWSGDGGFTVDGAHARARGAANLAHGELSK